MWTPFDQKGDIYSLTLYWAINDEAKKTTGEFRLIDGVTLLGMLQIPLHLRPAIAQESQIYTLAAPPQPIGRG